MKNELGDFSVKTDPISSEKSELSKRKWYVFIFSFVTVHIWGPVQYKGVSEIFTN